MLAALAATTLVSLEAMSFNIRFGTANDGENAWPLRRSALLTQLKAESPDVLGLQEALAGQLDEIVEAMPEYGRLGVGRDDGVSAGEHSAILYRRDRLGVLQSGTFWLSDTLDVIASKTWGNRITRVCTYALFQDRLNQRSFWVFNVHLDHESQPSRERSVDLVLKRIQNATPAAPSLVLGDFNAGESNPAVRAMVKGGFLDSFRIKHPDQKEVGTFTAFEKAGEDKIDYVFVSTGKAGPDWKVERAEILREKVSGRFTSDHYPVVATVLPTS